MRKTLVDRGSTFINACDVQHRGVPRHYSGFTLETREEVDSQVVIDFEEAFNFNDGGDKTAAAKKEDLVLQIFAKFLAEDVDYKDQFNGIEDYNTTKQKWKPVIKGILEEKSPPRGNHALLPGFPGYPGYIAHIPGAGGR